MVLFRWNLDPAVAIASLVRLALLSAFYTFVFLAPFTWPSCPYKTPLLPHVMNYLTGLAILMNFTKFLPDESTTVDNSVAVLDRQLLAWLDKSSYNVVLDSD